MTGTNSKPWGRTASDRVPYAVAGAAMRDVLMRANRLRLTAFQRRVLDGVLAFTVSYSKVADDLYLGTLASFVYGVERSERWQAKKVGRALADLARAGLIAAVAPPAGRPVDSGARPRYRVAINGSEPGPINGEKRGQVRSGKGASPGPGKGANLGTPAEKVLPRRGAEGVEPSANGAQGDPARPRRERWEGTALTRSASVADLGRALLGGNPTAKMLQEWEGVFHGVAAEFRSDGQGRTHRAARHLISTGATFEYARYAREPLTKWANTLDRERS